MWVMRANRSGWRICGGYRGRGHDGDTHGDFRVIWCALAKIDELHLDAVLHDSHDEDQYHLKAVKFPPPMRRYRHRAGAPRGANSGSRTALHKPPR